VDSGQFLALALFALIENLKCSLLRKSSIRNIVYPQYRGLRLAKAALEGSMSDELQELREHAEKAREDRSLAAV